MPHDVNGRELKVGDIVNIPCVITHVQMQEEYCNLNLETQHKMYPSDNPSSLVLNAKQVVLVESPATISSEEGE